MERTQVLIVFQFSSTELRRGAKFKYSWLRSLTSFLIFDQSAWLYFHTLCGVFLLMLAWSWWYHGGTGMPARPKSLSPNHMNAMPMTGTDWPLPAMDQSASPSNFVWSNGRLTPQAVSSDSKAGKPCTTNASGANNGLSKSKDQGIEFRVRHGIILAQVPCEQF